MKNLTVGMKFKTNNTPRGCYHVIAETDDKFTTYDTVYPNGMRPFTSSPTQGVLNWLNRPHIGLEIINPKRNGNDREPANSKYHSTTTWR